MAELLRRRQLFGQDSKTILAHVDKHVKDFIEEQNTSQAVYERFFGGEWEQVPLAFIRETGGINEALESGNIARAEELFRDFTQRNKELDHILAQLVSIRI